MVCILNIKRLKKQEKIIPAFLFLAKNTAKNIIIIIVSSFNLLISYKIIEKSIQKPQIIKTLKPKNKV
jgi:hypothetical protein